MIEEAKSIAAAISGVKATYDLVKASVDVRDGVKLQGLMVDLQRAILDAQQAALNGQQKQLELLEKIRNLENELAIRDRWHKIADRYTLVDYGGGTFAYELKVDRADGQPIHKLCPKCFSEERMSILQASHRAADGRDYHTCHHCKQNIGLGHGRTPSSGRIRPTEF